MSYKKLLAAVVYVSMVYIFAATSVVGPPPPSGAYLLSTDCTNPYSETEIAIASGSLASPGGATFSDFGLPTNTFYGESAYTGTIGATNRTCSRIVGRDSYDTREWAYSCKVDDSVVCTVLIQQR